MKRLYKSLLALFIVAIMSCGTVLADEIESTTVAENIETPTAPENQTAPVIPTDEEMFEYYVKQLVANLSQYDTEELEFAVSNSVGGSADIYSSYLDLLTTSGSVKGFGETVVEKIDNGYKVSTTLNCEKGNGKVVILCKEIGFGLDSITLYKSGKTLYVTEIVFSNVNANGGTDIGKAVLNTILGLGTVVIVLILIMCIIASFKYIDGFVNGVKNLFKKKEKKSNAAIDDSVAHIEQKDTDLTNDAELVAVIAAAIAASTGASTDSFVVRKIKRR